MNTRGGSISQKLEFQAAKFFGSTWGHTKEGLLLEFWPQPHNLVPSGLQNLLRVKSKLDIPHLTQKKIQKSTHAPSFREIDFRTIPTIFVMPHFFQLGLLDHNWTSKIPF